MPHSLYSCTFAEPFRFAVHSVVALHPNPHWSFTDGVTDVIWPSPTILGKDSARVPIHMPHHIASSLLQLAGPTCAIVHRYCPAATCLRTAPGNDAPLPNTLTPGTQPAATTHH